MEIGCSCPCLSWTSDVAPEKESEKSANLPKFQTEELSKDMVQRYQASPPPGQAAPAPHTKAERAATEAFSAPLFRDLSRVSPPVALASRAAQKKPSNALVREDDYGLNLAAFYGQVDRMSTLNTSGVLKPKDLLRKSTQSLARNS